MHQLLAMKLFGAFETTVNRALNAGKSKFPRDIGLEISNSRADFEKMIQNEVSHTLSG